MVKQKKNKHVLRPWCWYCERDFEDEKVLMQHQKAKHFKCGHCPRKLNTAGGLAVHIQQVHKLDPEPIENAIPGRNGYDVEIFGMEGIPAVDASAYKRKKEAEFGLPLGYFGTKNSAGPAGAPGLPPAKRNYENRVYTFDELKGMLETHRQLMGRDETANANKMDTSADGPVFMAGPQMLAAPPVPGMMPPMPMPGMPPMGAMGMPPPLSMTGPPGAPPMPVGMQFPPGMPGMPPFPPGPGAPPFPPGMLPPGFPPPGFAMPPPEALGGPPSANNAGPPPFASAPPPSALSSGPTPSISKPPTSTMSQGSPKKPMIGRSGSSNTPSAPAAAFDPVSAGLKEGTVLEWVDMNYSPLERRAEDPKYSQFSDDVDMMDANASGRMQRMRARAEDFLD